LYITHIVVFLTVFSTRVSLLSSKIHNRDDTAKGRGDAVQLVSGD